jgi:hypothetical protein
MIMKNIAQSGNFSVKAFCSWAKAKDLLKANNDNQNIIKLNGKTKRFYTIKLNYEDELLNKNLKKEEPEFEDAIQEELPF